MKGAAWYFIRGSETKLCYGWRAFRHLRRNGWCPVSKAEYEKVKAEGKVAA